MTSNKCIYPGSFDPPTNGHLDLIHRSLNIFKRVIVAVAINSKKTPLFSAEERVTLLRQMLDLELGKEEAKRVQVEFFEGLTINYAKKKKCGIIVRGLRAVSDFEYEFQMASMNRKLEPEVETMFMMTDEGNFYISSQTVKEVASLKGCVDGLVPKSVKKELINKYRRQEKAEKAAKAEQNKSGSVKQTSAKRKKRGKK